MSKKLSAEWQQKIETEIHEISKKFKIATEYGVGYDHGFHYGYALSAANYVPLLVEAQERIKSLEDKLYYIRESYSDAKFSIAFQTANEALSPVNPQKKQDE